MTDTQTTLSEFATTRDAEEADTPTPAENAAAISSLADLMEKQVDQTREALERLEQQEATGSIDTELHDGGRMFQ